MATDSQVTDWRRSAVVFGFALLLYILTMPPTIWRHDSAELTTAAATLGLTRATGYPLYIMLGHEWIKLVPLGDVAYRMNLLSCVFGAMTLAVLDRVLIRMRITAIAIIPAP